MYLEVERPVVMSFPSRATLTLFPRSDVDLRVKPVCLVYRTSRVRGQRKRTAVAHIQSFDREIGNTIDLEGSINRCVAELEF